MTSEAEQAALPPLPELFGNPMLRGQLAEIKPAANIDWLPQTPGWYALGALLLFWMGRALWRQWRRWLRNRYRREALQRLKQLANPDDPIAINEILKVTAMVASSRAEVAGLSGESWLKWLEARTPGTIFSPESRALLITGIYQAAAPSTTPDETPSTVPRPLASEARGWIMQHRDDHAPA